MNAKMAIPDRLIIESLRTGVPNPAVVRAMGSNQTVLLKTCSDLLGQTRSLAPRPSNGLVFFGDFGAGKSHALQSLAEEARQHGFIVSEGAVSRNLQIGDSRQLLSLILAQTTSKNHAEDALPETIADFVQAETTHTRFAEWAVSEHSRGRLSEHYKLIAQNINRVKYGSAEFEILMDFLHGNGSAPQVKSIAGRRPTGSLTQAERPWQTVRFLSRLFLEAGYAGWLILLDELELIRLVGTYPTVGRGKSYAGLARWMGLDSSGPTDGLAVIGCMTRGYVEQQILPGPDSPNELIVIPDKLRTSTNAQLAPIAQKALEFLVEQSKQTSHQLVRPSNEFLHELQSRVKSTYESAFGCFVSDKPIVNTEFEPIRVQIRRWIVQWDFERHGINTSVTVRPLHQTLDGDDEESFEFDT